MNYNIEQRPQSQPGACCLTGIHEDEWFIRLHTADAFTGSLIISKTAFEQLARELGFVPEGKLDRDLKEVREFQDGLAANLADLSSRVDLALSPLLNLKEAIQRIDREFPEPQIVDRGFDEPVSEPSDGTSESAEGSSEPPAKSQLDGIFPVGSKRTPGLPRTTGKN